MCKKLAILSVWLVVGALLASLYTERNNGKPVSVLKAEEASLSLFEKSADFPNDIGGGHSLAGLNNSNTSAQPFLASAIPPSNNSPETGRPQRPLFLLFQAFLFYDIA